MSTAGTHDGVVVDALARSPVLCNGSDAARTRLSERGGLRRYQKRASLFCQGDASDEVYVLVEGRVEISSVSADGHRQWHATIEPPELFGELGVLDGGERPSAATAISEVLVWAAPADALLDFLEHEPAAAIALLRALARQVHAYGSLVDDLLFLDLRGRVAKRLLGLVTTTFRELPADGVALPSVVTQSDLASLAAGSRENVCRIIAEFERSGLVARQGRRYVLRDVAGLSRLARIPV